MPGGSAFQGECLPVRGWLTGGGVLSEGWCLPSRGWWCLPAKGVGVGCLPLPTMWGVCPGECLPATHPHVNRMTDYVADGNKATY